MSNCLPADHQLTTNKRKTLSLLNIWSCKLINNDLPLQSCVAKWSGKKQKTHLQNQILGVKWGGEELFMYHQSEEKP